ncbi:MAG TPA: hypothetical protein VGV85_08175 [Longimicrobiaceae bacterium]|nr:hypothetical protein [Longimicrobiaceae bacterium]
MSVWQRRTRGTVFLGLLALGACGDDGVSPPRTSAADVAGAYRVCALAFTPTSRFLPAVDVRARGFELTTGGVTQPALKLDGTGTFELEYTPRGRFTDVEHRGTFGTRDARVVLSFASAEEVAPLLLPGTVDAAWDAAAKTLTVGDGLPYTASKADYERMLGEGDPGIPTRVEGRLSGRFAAGACE